METFPWDGATGTSVLYLVSVSVLDEVYWLGFFGRLHKDFAVASVVCPQVGTSCRLGVHSTR
jgi:hypothetical protein